MIRSFGVRDLLLVGNLQKKGVCLDPEIALTRPYSPLLAALSSYFPIHEAGTSTFILEAMDQGSTSASRHGERSPGRGRRAAEPSEHRRVQGLAQMRQRRGRPEADVIYLAPSLRQPFDEAQDKAQDTAFSTTDEVSTIWYRLLNHLCARAGERGIQRLFAHLTEDGEEIETFQQLGFSPYTREDIFCLNSLSESHRRLDRVVMRPQQAVDAWALQRLYANVAPRLVQQAESLGERGWERSSADWPLRSTRSEGYVLEDDGEIVSYLLFSGGRIGHWMRILLHPQAYDQADEVIQHSLAFLSHYPPCPIYCSVREYEGGLRTPLQDWGFEPFGSQAVLVKHTTVRIKEPTRKLVPALDKRAEVATPTMSRINNNHGI
jgi:GNAT superfamily N-acetyltransferase